MTFRRLKTEVYYFKELLLRRFPPKFYLHYIKNRFFSLRVLAHLPLWESRGRDDFEVHILSPRDGLLMAYWTVRTFLYHSGLSPKVVIHSDGSIDDKSARLIESKFNNLKVIQKSDADTLVRDNPTIPPIVKKIRAGKNILIMMFLDHYLLSKTNKVLVLDNDIIFYNRPQEIVDFMTDKTVLDAMVSRDHTELPLDIKDEYARRYQIFEKGGDYMNSGVILFKKNTMPMTRIVEYFENTTKPDGHFIEQAGWASLICQTNFNFLPEKTYKIKGGIERDTISKHFTSPRRYEMFAYGMEVAKKMTTSADIP